MMLSNNPMFYTLVPLATLIFGSVIASIKKPSVKVASATQHFAAGVVFAAVALELLPRLSAIHNNLALTIGFSLGVITMLMIKHITGGHHDSHDDTNHDHATNDAHNVSALPVSLITAIGIDLFIDGLLIGIAFIAGERGGLLVTLALAIEILFLSLSITTNLIKIRTQLKSIVLILISLSAALIFGTYLGTQLLTFSSPAVLEGILAFGVAALLYLVTEELLEEAHETPDTPLITSTFFAGFLIIYLLNQTL